MHAKIAAALEDALCESIAIPSLITIAAEYYGPVYEYGHAVIMFNLHNMRSYVHRSYWSAVIKFAEANPSAYRISVQEHRGMLDYTITVFIDDDPIGVCYCQWGVGENESAWILTSRNTSAGPTHNIRWITNASPPPPCYRAPMLFMQTRGICGDVVRQVCCKRLDIQRVSVTYAHFKGRAGVIVCFYVDDVEVVRRCPPGFESVIVAASSKNTEWFT